ncbi:MAG TPA: CDP-alcohol phosphatidyltransferase family protein [Chitinophagaceae bacterium]|nr:CDP-alcohol phosphatidyltransferase family protein [Chitinophagaceae bacterium]
MKHTANILTLGNLFCGVLAIIFILQTPDYLTAYNGQDYIVTAPEPIGWASVLIGLAALLDFLDGLAARILKLHSPLGKQLDSLADIVSFGVAPGLILYHLLRSAWMQYPGALDVSMIWLLPALLLPCFAALRLARFNIDPEQQQHFIGVPTPAVGLLIASFPLILLKDRFHLESWFGNPWFLYVIIFLLCYLMVSPLRMLSLKFSGFGLTRNLPRYLLILSVILGIPWLGYGVVPAVFILYIILSLAFKSVIK